MQRTGGAGVRYDWGWCVDRFSLASPAWAWQPCLACWRAAGWWTSPALKPAFLKRSRHEADALRDTAQHCGQHQTDRPGQLSHRRPRGRHSGLGTITLPEIVAALRDLDLDRPTPARDDPAAGRTWCKPGVRLCPCNPRRSSTVLLATGRDVFLGGEAATATFGRRDSFLLEPGSPELRSRLPRQVVRSCSTRMDHGMHLVDSTFQVPGLECQRRLRGYLAQRRERR